MLQQAVMQSVLEKTGWSQTWLEIGWEMEKKSTTIAEPGKLGKSQKKATANGSHIVGTELTFYLRDDQVLS